MRYEDAEFNWFKAKFGGTEDEIEFNLKMLRKVFLPEYDADAAIGQAISPYISIQTDGRNSDEIATDVKAVNKMASHIEVQLQVLKTLVGEKGETVEQMKERLLKNSAK